MGVEEVAGGGLFEDYLGIFVGPVALVEGVGFPAFACAEDFEFFGVGHFVRNASEDLCLWLIKGDDACDGGLGKAWRRWNCTYGADEKEHSWLYSWRWWLCMW